MYHYTYHILCIIGVIQNPRSPTPVLDTQIVAPCISVTLEDSYQKYTIQPKTSAENQKFKKPDEDECR